MHWPCAVGLAAPPSAPAASVASIQVALGRFDFLQLKHRFQQSVGACSSDAAVSFFALVPSPDAVGKRGWAVDAT
jgi:hypothetical protein